MALPTAKLLNPLSAAMGMDEDARCAYNREYSDVETGIARDYRCPRRRYGGSHYCIFHNPTVTDHDKIRDSFMSELVSGLDINGGGGPLLFIGCRMPSLDIACLRRSVCFVGAKFLGDVELHDARCGKIDFTDAKFAGQLAMASAAADLLSLRRAHFDTLPDNNQDVGNARKTSVDIRRCSFKHFDIALASAPSIYLSDCDFADSKLRGLGAEHLDVHGCKFNGIADFTSCTLGQSRFEMVTFGASTTFEGASFKRLARFTRVDFRQEELVKFCRSLSNVSFLNTNMTKVRFDADTVWNDDNSYVILDERELVDGLSASSLSDTLAVYRSLRECHEYWLMYDEAGQFYVREMDMRRCYKDTLHDGVARRRMNRYISLSNGYNVLCRYGESFRRASVWVASVFGVSAIYYWISPDQITLGDQNYMSSRLAAAVERTLAAFLHVGRDGIDDHIVRVASLPVLGSMFIVLKRRLERRFRH